MSVSVGIRGSDYKVVGDLASYFDMCHWYGPDERLWACQAGQVHAHE